MSSCMFLRSGIDMHHLTKPSPRAFSATFAPIPQLSSDYPFQQNAFDSPFLCLEDSHLFSLWEGRPGQNIRIT